MTNEEEKQRFIQRYGEVGWQVLRDQRIYGFPQRWVLWVIRRSGAPIDRREIWRWKRKIWRP